MCSSWTGINVDDLVPLLVLIVLIEDFLALLVAAVIDASTLFAAELTLTCGIHGAVVPIKLSI